MVMATDGEDPKGWVREWAQDMKRERVSQGMTMAVLAQLSGVPKGSLSRYETLEREPVLSNAMAISDALGMGIEW
tara:strand:- start:69 stop:293 length:225 start_codon:yes stop_codon:yes gene_type:complete